MRAGVPLMFAVAGSLLAGSCTTTPAQQVQSPKAQR